MWDLCWWPFSTLRHSRQGRSGVYCSPHTHQRRYDGHYDDLVTCLSVVICLGSINYQRSHWWYQLPCGGRQIAGIMFFDMCICYHYTSSSPAFGQWAGMPQAAVRPAHSFSRCGLSPGNLAKLHHCIASFLVVCIQSPAVGFESYTSLHRRCSRPAETGPANFGLRPLCPVRNSHRRVGRKATAFCGQYVVLMILGVCALRSR